MRPTYAAVNLSAIQQNLKCVRKIIGKKPFIMAVVKANAYGHGMLPIAETIIKNKSAEYFGVALVEEGIALRKAGVTLPIAVLTAPDDEQLGLYLQYNLELTLCSIITAKKLDVLANSMGKQANVHIKIDTGMGRIGITPKETMEFIAEVQSLENIFIKGISTHFATSDEKNLSYAHKQLSIFQTLVQNIKHSTSLEPIIHCANSGAILQMKESHFDMVRPGIMMYGYFPSQSIRKKVLLHPVMSVYSHIAFLKVVEKGTSIGYGRKYITKKKTTIATITVGYADGISRNLSQKLEVIINKKKYTIAGTIAMDQIMVDVGLHHDIQVGDSVIIIGKDSAKQITAWDIANQLQTIPYEITCAISERIPRKYIYG